jgi:hypothetical protein
MKMENSEKIFYKAFINSLENSPKSNNSPIYRCKSQRKWQKPENSLLLPHFAIFSLVARTP